MTSMGDWQVLSQSHHNRSHSTLHCRHKVVAVASVITVDNALSNDKGFFALRALKAAKRKLQIRQHCTVVHSKANSPKHVQIACSRSS